MFHRGLLSSADPMVLLLLLGCVAAVAGDAHASSTRLLERQTAHRKLQSATIIPLISGSVTANLPVAPFSSVTAPFTLPLFFWGIPGTPSPASPKRYYTVNCDNPRPTFVLVPGVSGSQIDSTQAGNAGNCHSFSSPRQVWADPSWMKNLECWAHVLSVGYDPKTGRYSNSSGTQTMAWEGGWPDGSDMQLMRTYFAGLWKHLEENYGYRRGVDLFGAPYDWRMDFDGLNQIGQFDQIAARITAAVQQNCGQKAVILAHSMGANFMLRMLRDPRFQSWRQQNVCGLIMVGAALSGSAAAAWQTRLSGVVDLFPAFTNAIPEFKLALIPTLPFNAAVYAASRGMPGFNVLLPTDQPLGKGHVLVKTPSRSYTVGQQKQLLLDMGDDQAATLLEKVQAQNQALIDAGPIPGVEMACAYGIATPTPVTLVYGEDIKYREVMRRPVNVIKAPGDGAVELKALRLCNKLAPASNIVEINDPSIDHSAVTREPAGLAALDGLFAKMGMRKGTPVAAAQSVGYPVINFVRPAAPVVEERGTKG